MAEQCTIPISIGSYKDEVTCDVLDMDACHILLGRPWEFDTHALHEGRTNVYKLQKDGKKFSLGPLPPKVVHKAEERGKKSPSILFMAHKECARAIEEEGRFVALVVKGEDGAHGLEKVAIPVEVQTLLDGCSEIIPSDDNAGLPPLRDI